MEITELVILCSILFFLFTNMLRQVRIIHKLDDINRHIYDEHQAMKNRINETFHHVEHIRGELEKVHSLINHLPRR
jgi:5-bromo-4-chloroindolyl phosphate hydrolysis protein